MRTTSPPAPGPIGWLAAALTLACLVAGCSPRTEPAPPGLSVRDGRFHLAGHPFRGVGANYYDLFTRPAARPTDTSTLDGLAQLANAGVPFVRFNAGGFTTADWQRYHTNAEAHFAVMDRVVQAAEQHGVGLIPSLFWTRTLHRVVGERGDAWGNPDSRTIDLMRRYTDEMVRRYQQSPAIWAWEFGNEWNLSADLPNAAQFRKPGEDAQDDLQSSHLATALREFARTVRARDATRPLLTGHSHPRASAWHNTRERSWKKDSRDQWLEVLDRENPPEFDTVGIHIYADSDVREACGAWSTGWPDYLGHLRRYASATRRPLFIGEFGLAEGGAFSPSQVQARYRDILAAMTSADVDLAAVWVFDLPSQKNTWNITLTNGRAYMLHAAVTAHREWARNPRGNIAPPSLP